MKTGDHSQCFIRLNQKHKRIGEVPEQGTMHVFVNGGELPGIGRHSLNHRVHLSTETPPEARSFVLVPILRID